jgi:hypothetical protein
MSKLTSSIYFKSFLGTLIVLSFAFIGALAVVEPACNHCTMSIAYKALTGAEYLTGGWLIAAAIYVHDFRQLILSKVVAGLLAIRAWLSPANFSAYSFRIKKIAK